MLLWVCWVSNHRWCQKLAWKISGCRRVSLLSLPQFTSPNQLMHARKRKFYFVWCWKNNCLWWLHLCVWVQFFKGWIVLSNGSIAVQWISVNQTFCAIHEIEIYQVDSVFAGLVWFCLWTTRAWPWRIVGNNWSNSGFKSVRHVRNVGQENGFKFDLAP